MRNNGRNTVKTRPATRNTYSSRNSSSTRYGRNTYSSSRNYGSRNYPNYGMNNTERGYYSSNRYNCCNRRRNSCNGKCCIKCRCENWERLYY